MYLESNMDKLKKQKKELGWSNQKLSQESGVPVGTVNKIFSGATRYPRQETMDAIVKALGLDYYPMEDFGAGVSIVRETSSYMAEQKREDDRATLETYYALPDDTRAELIDGKIYYMNAPNANHQIILGELFFRFKLFLDQSELPCHAFLAPFDVCLDLDDFTILQPDVMIICDQKKIEGGIRCDGAPDLTIEIVSPSNPRHDYYLKLQKYQNAGVREYWIVDPQKRRVMVYTFEDETIPKAYTFEDIVRSVIYPGLEVDFKELSERLI